MPTERNRTISPMKAYFRLVWSGLALAFGLASGLRAQITANASVSQAVQTDGQSITLTRDGSASAGIAWTENVIQKPNSTTVNLGNMGLGSMSYTPNGGPGVYWYNFRIRDNNGVYADQSIPFVVGSIAGSNATTTVGQGVGYSGIIESQDRIINGATAYANGVSYATADMNSYDPDPYSIDFAPGFLSWSVGTYTLRISVESRPYGREDASTPETPGVSESTWYRDFTITVNKSTPVGLWYPAGGPLYGVQPTTFSAGAPVSANRQGYYTMTSGDVSAFYRSVFVHPAYVSEPWWSWYTGAPFIVAGPTSPVTYRLTGTSTALAAGLQVPTGTVAVEAVFPGNSNYNSATSASSFVVQGPTAPATLLPVFGSSLTLSWAAVSGATAYDIYRNGVFLATVSSGTTYVDTTNPVAGSTATHTYEVRAVDSSNRGSVATTVTLSNPGGLLEVFAPTP